MDNIYASDKNLVNQGDNLKNSTFQASSSAINEIFQSKNIVSDTKTTDTASKYLMPIDIWDGIPSTDKKNSEEKQQQKDRKKSDEDKTDKKDKRRDWQKELEDMIDEDDTPDRINEMLDGELKGNPDSRKKPVLKAR